MKRPRVVESFSGSLFELSNILETDREALKIEKLLKKSNSAVRKAVKILIQLILSV